MPAIDFPAAPAVNDEYSFEGRTWRWNGTGWEVKEYPAALLAGTAANPSLYFSGDANTGLYSPGADQVAISTGGSPKLAVIANGNVGIGTLTPAFELHFGPAASASTAGRIGFGDISATPVCMIEGFRDSGSFAGSLRFHTTTGPGVNTERLRITSAGNVGIGTSSPSNLLHVFNGANSGVSALISAENNHTLRLARVAPAASPGNFDLQVTSNGAGNVIADSSIALQSGTNAAITLNTGGANERARIDSSGRLLVGTSAARTNFSIGGTAYAPQTQLEGGVLQASFVRAVSPYIGLAASNTVAANDSVGNVSFFGSDGTNFIRAAEISAAVDGTPGANDMPGRLVFSTTADGAASPTEAMRINNQRELLIGTTTRTANGGVLQISNGITFPGTQSACSDANTLDDYEEGTFTPTIIGTTTAGTGTYSVQVGRYTKVGNLVRFQVFITWSAHTGTGNMRVAGLPFVNVNVTDAQSPAAVAPSNLTFSNSLSAFTVQNTTQVYLHTYATGGAEADLPIDTAASIRVAGVYETA